MHRDNLFNDAFSGAVYIVSNCGMTGEAEIFLLMTKEWLCKSSVFIVAKSDTSHLL